MCIAMVNITRKGWQVVGILILKSVFSMNLGIARVPRPKATRIKRKMLGLRIYRQVEIS
jgi:hypothetical protein